MMPIPGTTGVKRRESLRVEPILHGRLRPRHRRQRQMEVLEVLEVLDVREVLIMFLREYTERKPGGMRRRREKTVSRGV